MAVLILIGVMATLLATEPASSAAAEAGHDLPGHRSSLTRAFRSALASLRDFLSHDLAIAVLAMLVVLNLVFA